MIVLRTGSGHVVVVVVVVVAVVAVAILQLVHSSNNAAEAETRRGMAQELDSSQAEP